MSNLGGEQFEHLRAVNLGFIWANVVSDAIIKNANFPNLQRTKNER